MFRGNIQLEDHIIDWHESAVNPGSFVVTVIDLFPGADQAPVSETYEVDQTAFFKALAIAVHPDGTPDAEKDYPEAESAMGSIRWIP